MADDQSAASAVRKPPLDDPSVELSARRIGMSFQRTRMSADRTLMSVIRTSISLISFGFLREEMKAEGLVYGESHFPVSLTLLVALALLVIGIFALLSMTR